MGASASQPGTPTQGGGGGGASTDTEPAMPRTARDVPSDSRHQSDEQQSPATARRAAPTTAVHHQPVPPYKPPRPHPNGGPRTPRSMRLPRSTDSSPEGPDGEPNDLAHTLSAGETRVLGLGGTASLEASPRSSNGGGIKSRERSPQPLTSGSSMAEGSGAYGPSAISNLFSRSRRAGSQGTNDSSSPRITHHTSVSPRLGSAASPRLGAASPSSLTPSRPQRGGSRGAPGLLSPTRESPRDILIRVINQVRTRPNVPEGIPEHDGSALPRQVSGGSGAVLPPVLPPSSSSAVISSGRPTSPPTALSPESSSARFRDRLWRTSDSNGAKLAARPPSATSSSAAGSNTVLLEEQRTRRRSSLTVSPTSSMSVGPVRSNHRNDSDGSEDESDDGRGPARIRAPSESARPLYVCPTPPRQQAPPHVLARRHLAPTVDSRRRLLLIAAVMH